MNEAQFLLSLGLEPKDLSEKDGIAAPALVSPKHAMVHNPDLDGLVHMRDGNQNKVPHSRRLKAWV